MIIFVNQQNNKLTLLTKQLIVSTGTPPREVIEEVAEVIVLTIPHQKTETGPATKESESTPPAPKAKSSSVKRAILQEQSSTEKKKHE
ncbi:hypothetical protein Tco_0939553 [Tanacetum coccineum]|uniref:Uncharacterized protein n=1 Tax=Tanacetum coccineum TaxID=301880 RepID=A0ABQ5DMZ2_9ASTR